MLNFEQLVLPLRPELVKFANYKTKFNQAWSEDLVQDTMLKAYKAWDRFDGRNLWGWLVTILVNTLINDLRRSELGNECSIDNVGELIAPVEYEDLEISPASQDALGRISNQHREIIDLRYFKDLTYDQIGVRLEIPVGTVKSRLHRAHREFRLHYVKEREDGPVSDYNEAETESAAVG